ncbi:MAG: tetratricopeptide repeat protein [Candidatus Hermodarchaeota archaeon]
MSEIHIPLYYSNLQNFIPEGEDVIYSAFYKVSFKESISDPFKINKMWDTHVLFTKKGFYYGEYQRKMLPNVKYVSWSMVKKITKKTIKLSRPGYKLKITRELNFESRRTYKTRMREFLSKIQPIMEEGIKIAPTEFLKQIESNKINAEKEKTQLCNILGDKYEKGFDKVIELIKFERHLRGEDKVGTGAFYKDIRKNRMKNQVHMQAIDLIVAVYGLAFLPMSILLGIFLILNELTISIMIASLILLILTGFHRYWIRKKNFELKKESESFKQAKGISEQYFLKSLSKLPKNLEGFQIMRLMSFGSKAYQERDFEKSVRIFQQILKFNTQLDMTWYMVLESLSYLARWEEMVSIGEEAIKIHPNFGPNYHWLADAYYEVGKKDKALEYYKKGLQVLKKVLEKDPKDDNILNSVGYNYLRMEEYEEAVKYYKEAIKFRPKNEHHLHSLGQTYMKMGLYDKAITYLEKSLECNPKHSYSWFDLGLIYENSNQLEKAIECFEKAVEYYPQWVKIREKLIRLKPDSSVLFKKPQEDREKTAGDDLYDVLHIRRKEESVKKYEANLNSLLNMNEKQLRVYLTGLVSSYRRRIERFKDNKRIPPFLIERLKIQKEYKEQLLVNLREYPDYIVKFRKIIENDIEFYRVRTLKKEKTREEYLESLFNLLLEMPYDQLIIYFKEEILMKQEMLKYNPMDDEETEMSNLAFAYVKETLKKLEDNRAYIQKFRKEINQGLDELNKDILSVFNEKLFYLF